MTIIEMLTLFIVGAASFFAPCSVPLIPGAIAAILHGAGAPGEASDRRNTILLAAVIFVLTYALAFAVASARLGTISEIALEQSGVLSVILGVILIVLASALLGSLGKGPADRMAGRTGIFTTGGVLGIATGLLWIPCVGPGLGAALTAAATPATADAGAIALVFYGVGIGIPLLIIAAAVASSKKATHAADRAGMLVRVSAATIIFIIGAAMATGFFSLISSSLATLTLSLGLAV